MSTLICQSKSGIIAALKECLWRDTDTVRIVCNSFSIELRSPYHNNVNYSCHCERFIDPWQQSILMAREKAIKRLIKRIRKCPKSLFKPRG